MAQVEKNKMFQLLGEFLEYPTKELQGKLNQLDDPISSISNMALFHVQEFMANIKKMTFSQWQEYYVRTFDVTPQCGLYLSVFLFGEENYKRSELMTGLKAAYEKEGPYEMTELPDHLAVVLRQNGVFSEEEWSDLVSMCLLPALPKIIEILEKNNNPYAFLLKTIQEVLVKTEKVYA